MLLLAAFIWGIAFVAQSVGMDYMGPCTFNASRFLIGGIVLLPVIWTKERMEEKKGATGAPAKKKEIRRAFAWRRMLRYRAVCGKPSAAVWYPVYVSGKSRIPDDALYRYRAAARDFCAPHSRCEGMVQRCGCVNRNVSSMYFRKRSDRTGGWVGDRLRVCIFHSYSGGGSFCRAGGWRKAFVSAVSDERRHLSGACVFDGASVLECIVCRNRAGFIRGRSVQRRWVYASGCRTEKSGANSGIPAFEHGICFFRAGRLGDFGTEAFGAGAFGLRARVYCGDLRTASG